MPEYSNLNRGVLFKNSKKTKDSQPDYQGRLDMNGEEHFISAWIEKSRAGEIYMSIRVNDRTDVKNGDGKLESQGAATAKKNAPF